jgi:AraC-like DNA-binding protein
MAPQKTARGRSPASVERATRPDTTQHSTRDRRRADLAILALVTGDPSVVRVDRPSVIFTIEWATARCGADTLDRSNVLITSRAAAIGTLASTTRIGVIGFHEPLLAAVEREYRALGLERRRFDRWLRARSVLPRTTWLHEILHRYVFERHALGHHDNQATRFLEVEIAKEIYFLFRDRDLGADRATIVRAPGAPVERALRYIETHLFEPCDAAALAKIAAVSSSTLLRQFRGELGCGPGAYWRNRKLDEALIALRSGRSVAEVATRVGYDNPTAFGFAFRRRFGRPPSAYRPTGRVRGAP